MTRAQKSPKEKSVGVRWWRGVGMQGCSRLRMGVEALFSFLVASLFREIAEHMNIKITLKL